MNAERHIAPREAAPLKRNGCGGAGAGAEVILIPKQLRMEWTDLLALDSELSDLALRVAAVIGYHLNRHRGDTYVTQHTIAALTGRDVRTIRRAVEELERRGYLIVDRRDLGARKSDGRKVSGGRGVANTYAPAVDRQQVLATARGLNLAERCAEIAAQRRAAAPSLEEPKEGTGALLTDDQRRAPGAAKEGMGVLPTLGTLPSEANPTRAAAAQRRHRLGAGGAALERRIGVQAFRIWFDDVILQAMVGDTLTLCAPGRMVRDRILSDYRDDVIASWQCAGFSISTLTITVRS